MQKELIIKDDEPIYENNGLMWTKTFPKMDWHEAVDFCQNLNYGGYTDWRLASIDDLCGIIDRAKYDPATELPGTVSSSYWSATTDASTTGIAWGVNFDYGYVNYDAKSSSYYVRAVRGGQS